MKVHIHSVVAAITNSSSEMYTFAHNDAISMAKAAIEEILSMAGFHEKASELFDIEVRASFSEYDKEYNEKTVNVVARTDAEVRALNQRIQAVTDEECQPNLNLSIVVIRKFGKKEMDLVSLFGQIVHSEEVSTG